MCCLRSQSIVNIRNIDYVCLHFPFKFQGMDELLFGTGAKLHGEPVNHRVFSHPLPFNLIPHIDKFEVRCLI